MDLQHSKSFAALNQYNCQLFKPKPLSVKQQMTQLPMQNPRVQIQALTTPKTIEYDSNPYLNQQLYSFKSSRISTEFLNGSPIDQIQLILKENEKLKRSLNQKQQIIESLSRTRKLKARLDFIDLQKNSRSLVQLQSQQESIKPKNIEIKQSISQNYNKRIKLPKIEDSVQINLYNLLYQPMKMIVISHLPIIFSMIILVKIKRSTSNKCLHSLI